MSVVLSLLRTIAVGLHKREILAVDQNANDYFLLFRWSASDLSDVSELSNNVK